MWSEHSHISPRMLYCFTYSCFICKSVCVFAPSDTHSARDCVCVPSQVQPITLILFTSPLLGISNIPYAFLDFKAYPRRGTWPLPRHTHAGTKGVPPRVASPFCICKTWRRSRAEKQAELSGPLAGLPCGQMGRGGVW